MKAALTLGVLGGSGVYEMAGVELVKDHSIDTPFGKPSDQITEVRLDGRRAFFLPRHGRGHRYLPSEVNYRANIYALKSLGVNCVLAVSAVGIMKEQIHPGDMVIPDQIFDRTKGVRAASFFGDGIVGHVEFADPFSAEMIGWIETAARAKTNRLHKGGAYVCIEGPQFSTRAESRSYCASLAPSVIGMTGIPEAKLAREAEMLYGMLALATDYDCWRDKGDDVSVEAVLAVLKANSSLAKTIVKELLLTMPKHAESPIFSAAQYSILTAAEAMPAATKKKLQLLYGKYLG